MNVFIGAIIVVILISLLWMVKELAQISGQVGSLTSKFDSLIRVLERIEKNTEDASKFLGEESEAYQEWKHELEVTDAD